MPDAQYAPFEYVRLEAAKQGIRLVRIVPSSDEIKGCIIETFPLKDAPEFTAISYRWGDPSRSIPILANGHKLGITASLDEFLLEALSRVNNASDDDSWCKEWLWIDAICINQDDVVERGQQVILMKDIFEASTKVVMWLGPAPRGGGEVRRFFDDIWRLFNDYDGPLYGETTSHGAYRFRYGDGLLTVSKETLVVVSKLFRNPYWKRGWIIQEASTPRTSLICYGPLTIPWLPFSSTLLAFTIAEWNHRAPGLADICATSNRSLSNVVSFKRRRASGTEEFTLYQTLVDTRRSRATDPRDHVYAILALVRTDDLDLSPDYTLTVAELYIKVAKAMIFQMSSLDCLGAVHYDANRIVPSWVPDWRSSRQELLVPFYGRSKAYETGTESTRQGHLYRASGFVPMEVQFSSEHHRLEARGISFDIIVAISRCRRRQDLSEELWVNWTQFADPSDSIYFPGMSRREAFEKLLITDVKPHISGDRSAERGGFIDGYDGPTTNMFSNSIVNAMTNMRRLVITAGGYLGLASEHCKIGDKVAILFGSQMPLVLRQRGQHWNFICQVYVQDVMDGEALVGVDLESTAQMFSIV